MFDTIFPLIISDTDLTLWSECELRWFRARCQCLTRTEFNVDLTAGGAFASGMESVRKAYYNDKLPAREAIDLGKATILTLMHSQNVSDDELKSPERMAFALEKYFKEFPLEDEDIIPAQLEDGSFAIEHKLTAELPILHPVYKIPLIFKGKLDLLAQRMNRLTLVDEKTTKQISSNLDSLLATEGQFIGYAWLARQHGITISAAEIRKIAIQKTDIKFKAFDVPITDFMIGAWEQAFLTKVKNMVLKYLMVTENPDKFKDYFVPDYKLGCTAYFKACPFQDGCTTKFGESFIETNFTQMVWNSETRMTVPLTEFKKLVSESDDLVTLEMSEHD